MKFILISLDKIYELKNKVISFHICLSESARKYSSKILFILPYPNKEVTTITDNLRDICLLHKTLFLCLHFLSLTSVNTKRLVGTTALHDL